MNGASLPHVDPRWGAAAYLGISAIVMALVWAALPASAADFRRYLGGIDPRLLYLAIALAGGGALWLLGSRFGFPILRAGSTLRGLGAAAALAGILGAAIIAADIFLRYPQDLNVPYPRALLFYPAIGFAAEVIFHLLPLALLLLALSPLAGSLGEARLAWIAILLTAALEPIFQVVFSGEPLSGRNLYTLIHVFLIALGQLALFRRYDFITMYSMRLFYYSIWHIIWGVLRLDLLF